MIDRFAGYRKPFDSANSLYPWPIAIGVSFLDEAFLHTYALYWNLPSRFIMFVVLLGTAV